MRRWSYLLVGVATGLVAAGCDDRPFVTAVDLPLQVIALAPAAGSVGVAREASVIATFNLALVESSVVDGANFYLENIADEQAPVKIEAAIAYRAPSGDQPPQAQLTPAAKLVYSTPYRITLTTGIARLADTEQNLPAGQLLQQVTAVFTTLDPPPLQIVSIAPAAGASGVARDTAIAITFSEPVRCASVEAGVVVTETFDPHPHTAGPDRAVAGSWSCSEPASIEETTCTGSLCSAVFTPDDPFAYSSHIAIALAGGSRDEGAIESFRATATGGQLPADQTFGFTVEDPDPLVLVSISPAAGSEQVALDAALLAAFSEPLECATVNANTVQVTMTLDPLRGGTTAAVAGALGCSDGDDFFDFVPAADFDWSALIRVTIAGGAWAEATYPDDAVESSRATSHAGQLPDDIVFEFRAADPPPLYVISTIPDNGAEGVPLDSAISILFSEVIDCASVSAAINHGELTVAEIDDGGVAVIHSVAVASCSGASLVLDPAPDFSYSGLVSVTLPASILSQRATSRGGSLAGGYVLGFRALDPPALSVVSTIPANGATGVPLDSSISVLFSEAIDCASVSAAISHDELIVAETGDDGIAVIHTVSIASCAGATLELDPAPDFTYSGQVSVTLPATITSLRATSRGGSLVGGYGLQFLALDPPALLVTSTLPGNGSATDNLATNLTVVFSEEIACATVDVTQISLTESKDDGTTDTSNTVAVANCSGATLILDPANDFAMSSAIAVSLPATIESARATSRGGTLEGGYGWAFETADPPMLLVLYTSPGDGNTLVPTDKLIIVRFSEAIDLATIDETTFVVEDLTDGIRLCDTAANRICSYAASDGDTIITVTPPADYEFDHLIRFTLTSAIASARATSQGGQLGADLPYTFETIPVPPIEVVLLAPPAGSSAIPIRPTITVTFNQDVLGSTLVMDDTNPAAVTVWLNPGPTPNVATRVPLTCGGVTPTCASTGTTFSFAPTSDLVGGAQYVFVIEGNINGIRGAVGGSIMIDDYLAAYSTSTNTLVAFSDPADVAVDVAVDRRVCVVFVEDIVPATITPATFAVSFENDLGTESPLVADVVAAPPAGYAFDGVDPATGAPSAAYTSNRVCFVPGAAQYGCRDIDELLPAGAHVLVRLAETIAGESGATLVGGWEFSFDTGGLEQLVELGHRNVLGGVGDLDGAAEIPVNAALTLTFSAPVSATSVHAAVTLVRLDTGADVPLDAVVLEEGGAVAVLQPSNNLLYLDDLAEGYELRIVGGASGIRTADGRYLDSHRLARFVTSPKTTVVFSPGPGEDLYHGMTTPAIFSRPMHLPSISTASFIAHDNTDDRDLTTIIATDIADLDSAALVPVPAYITGHTITFTLTTAVQDYLGNPLPQDAVADFGAVLAGAQETSCTPDEIRLNDLSPNSGNVSGDQIFTLTMSTTMARYKNRMLPPSFNDRNIVITESGCSGARGALEQENWLVRGALDQPDQLRFRAQSLLRHGCSYQITLVQKRFANVYTFSSAFDDIVATVTGETSVPSVSSSTPANNATGVAADAAIAITFSEAMDPATFDPASSMTVGASTGTVHGVITVSGATATFVPDAPLDGGLLYTVSMSNALTDLAGNALAAATRTFTVESTSPQVTGIAIPALDRITIAFNEKIDGASVVPDTDLDNGSIQVRDAGGGTVYGCVELDAALTTAVFRPLVPLAAGASYQVTVTTGVTDLGGTALASQVQQTIPAP